MTRFDRVRRAAYTGENRCWPCTVANGVVVGGAVAVLWTVGAPLIALVAGVVGGVAIWLRGYVVPYTPTFAPRLAARLPGDVFGHDGRVPLEPPAQAGSYGSLGDVEADDADPVVDVLAEAGVLVATDDRLELAPEFEAEWAAELAALRRLETSALADATGDVAGTSTATAAAGADAVTDQEWVVLSDAGDGVEAETWLSRPVAIADVGAARALEGRVADASTRRRTTGPLRLFLDECPDCTTPLVEETTASCCGGHRGPGETPDAVLACPECDVWVADLPDVD